MRIMGLDIGDKRIGVALSDPLGILASPHTIIERRDDTADINTIIDIAGEYGVETVIVGLPLSLNGSIGEQAVKVQVFADNLIKHTKIPVEFRDERLTTVTAQRMMKSARKKPGKQKSHDDAAAAAVILQGYLDEKE